MGKISQAERWILFVMLHCPPLPRSRPRRHPLLSSLSVYLRALLTLCISTSCCCLRASLSSCLHTLPGTDTCRTFTRAPKDTHTHSHNSGSPVTKMLHLGSKNHKTCQGINPLIFHNFIYINPLLHACSPATIPLTGECRGENVVRREKKDEDVQTNETFA